MEDKSRRLIRDGPGWEDADREVDREADGEWKTRIEGWGRDVDGGYRVG